MKRVPPREAELCRMVGGKAVPLTEVETRILIIAKQLTETLYEERYGGVSKCRFYGIVLDQLEGLHNFILRKKK